jgi:hypothetical protein
MGTSKAENRSETKPVLTAFEAKRLLTAFMESGQSYSKKNELDARILTWDLLTHVKFSLGCIFVCSFLMLNWKTWYLHFPQGTATIHFPRLLGLSLIEAVIVKGLGNLRVHKHFKWGMRGAAVAIAVAISIDLRPQLLEKPWLQVSVLFLWAVGISAFLYCMTLLFVRMDVYKVAVIWFTSMILVILLCVFYLLYLIGMVIHQTLGSVLLIILFPVFLLAVFALVDAFLLSLVPKWKQGDFREVFGQDDQGQFRLRPEVFLPSFHNR